ncbi:MAG: hypothetical protein LBQ57_00035 [Spirochaetales bacterium]|nr:hypothetical protein [Spirochaetales bacterium]
MADLLEALMVISFGISWPANIIKSWRVRTTKGKSIIFLIFVEFGYVCGIFAKIVNWNITYVFLFYLFNFVMVGVDILLYFRNKKLDRLNGA